MELTNSAVEVAQPGTAIYMLHWGEHYERGSNGPYLGAAGLDFTALSADYRRERYAAAEAAHEDRCPLGEGDFQTWLVAKQILSPIASTDVEIDVRTYGNEYVPKHWPECPECSGGRGEQDYGDVRRSLNRIVVYHRCTECRHVWGHHEVACRSGEPMLEDDGRDTQGGCVPFSISKACGIDWKLAVAACAKHGWDSGGMSPDRAVVAARELGFELVRQRLPGSGKPNGLTLKSLISGLPRNRNYVVSVKGHWLALVGGAIVDNDTNSGLGRKVVDLYEVKAVQSAAA